MDPILPHLAPLQGQNGVKYCIIQKSDPVPFLQMQKYTSGANFVKIGWKLRFDPIWPRFRAKMGSNTALPKNLTPYPFFKCKNTPLVRILLKSGENSDLTPFDPVSGPKWGFTVGFALNRTLFLDSIFQIWDKESNGSPKTKIYYYVPT